MTPLVKAEQAIVKKIVRWHKPKLKNAVRSIFISAFGITGLAFGGLVLQMRSGNDPSLGPKARQLAALSQQKVVQKVITTTTVVHKTKTVYVRVHLKPKVSAASTPVSSVASAEPATSSYSAAPVVTQTTAPQPQAAPAPTPVATRVS
jgi:hypothetical protein